ncbi:hypothetical protein Q5P01_008116 [Channa striata]|uniref:PHD and RING finger domain-containing protein 1 n=1 Tax=Channa striata TaxID=64152 RepID=A0AA88N5E3_CHASR|nr:hypothetical protein Q5P01_008116 [Channa striata]
MNESLTSEGPELMSDKCYICLSAFDRRSVASLDNCPHLFCVQCILRWAQTSNTCPVDRVRFSFVQQRRGPGGDIVKKIKVSVQQKDDDELDQELASNAVNCEECGRSDRGHQLIMCIHCDSGYHMGCLSTSLNPGPEGEWICPDCVGSAHHAEEEISDGELMDLLAEVDGNASTRSRLRPSTLNLQSNSAERKRSTRVQSRMSSNPHRQTSWHVPKYLLRASRSAAATNDYL